MFLQSSLDVFQVTMLSKCFSIHHEAGKPCYKERCEKCICVSRHFKQQLVSLFFNQVSRLIFNLKSFQLSVCKISLIKYENWIKLKETLYFFSEFVLYKIPKLRLHYSMLTNMMRSRLSCLNTVYGVKTAI